jgi:hypothetical protein
LTLALGCRTGHRLAGQVRHPYAGVDYIPQSGTKNFASGLSKPVLKLFTKFSFVNNYKISLENVTSLQQWFCQEKYDTLIDSSWDSLLEHGNFSEAKKN